MPYKGDDLDNAIVDAHIEHLSNAQMQITPKGGTHPSTATACVRGIFRLDEYESAGSLPVFLFKTDSILDPLTQNIFVPKKGDLVTVDAKWAKNGQPIKSVDYTVQETKVQSADTTLLALQLVLP